MGDFIRKLKDLEKKTMRGGEKEGRDLNSEHSVNSGLDKKGLKKGKGEGPTGG